jgi:hypothetical protein
MRIYAKRERCLDAWFHWTVKVRVFTRIINGDRQVYLAMVLYMEQDANITRFINSFTITPPTKSKSQKK